jgi:signal transduction histidine kinase
VDSDTGWGLAISYQIVVEKYHSRLACISELGQETEFLIKFFIKKRNSQK